MEVTRKAVIDRKIVPVLAGASFKNKGIQRLLDAIVALLPSPLDIGPVTGENYYTKKEEERMPEAETGSATEPIIIPIQKVN